MPQPHTITITGINPDGSLILDDNGTTSTHRTDTVTWKIGPNSGVWEIVDIRDTSNLDVFNPDPRGVGNGNGRNFEGTINPNLVIPNPPKSVEESYCIDYRTSQGGTVQTHDPKIIVNG